jgi:hypothetical protein
MKIKLITFVLVGISQAAYAHKYKTKDFCSINIKDICAHIGYDLKPADNSKFKFTFDIVNKKKAQFVKDVDIKVISGTQATEKKYFDTTWKIRPDGHHWDAETIQPISEAVVGIKMDFLFEDKKEQIEVMLD